MKPEDSKVRRAKKVVDAGMNIPLAQLQEFIDLNDKVQELVNIEKDSTLNTVLRAITAVKGEKGDSPSKEELISLIEPLIPEPKHGIDGEDYVLTENDKKEIAKSINVPIVEKIIEKTEVIIEKPIITNEIKEVAVTDTPNEIVEKVNKSDKKIKSTQVEGLIESFDNLSKSVTMGGVQAPILDVYNAGVLVKTRVTKINFSSGATVLSDTINVATGGSAVITTQDEGTTLSTLVSTLNFVGAGVTASGVGAITTVTIPGGGGSTPTGTGFTHITAGVQDAAAKLVDTADINNSQVTLGKMADVATGTVFYRKTAATGVPEVQTLATLKTDLGLTGTNSGDQTITLTGHVTGSGTGSFATSTASKMILQGTADATTSAAQFLGALGTGIVKNTTTTGVLSIAVNSDLPVMTATVGGAVPTPPNNTTTFLRGDGTFATPAGSGDMVLANTQTNSGVKTFLDTTMALRNFANTFSGVFTNTITAARVWTLKDASGTIAFTSDITGTNSGTNTGDQTITLTGGVTGTGTGSFAATVVTNANLTGDVTSVGNATTLTNAPVIAKVLTGYISGAGVVAATDSILAAFQKINGNDALKAPLASPTFTGIVTTPAITLGAVALTSTGTELNFVTGVTSSIQTQLNSKQATGSYEVTTNKDATGGYAGLTLFKINFKNAANTFTSFFTNANTAARTYTFQDRDGTISDNTDLALKANLASPTFTGTVVLPSGQALIAPALGTPASGVMTNVIGTATGLTSGITLALKSATTTVDVSASAAPSTGQVLTATAGTTATWQTPSGGTGTTWTEVTTTSQAAAVSNGYVTNNVALVTVTLPASAAVGQIVYVQGSGAGGFKLAQNALQLIQWDAGAVAGLNVTTTGITGSISSSDRYDSIEVMCIVANTTFVVRNSKGNLLLV